MHEGRWAWIGFAILIASALALDVRASRISAAREVAPPLPWAIARCVVWVLLSLGFGAAVRAMYGPPAAVTYVTAYVLEASLSIDNIMAFALVFSYTHVPARYQREIMLWAVPGALALRAALIAAGLFALGRFHWIVYPFAALIIFAALRLLVGEQKQRAVIESACEVCSTWVARLIPITPRIHGRRFVLRHDGRTVATPLFVALVIIVTTDIVLAMDSVPAVLAITRDPFIVYSSNVFATLTLWSLYFVLAGVVDRLRFLRTGLAVLLVLVGAELLSSGVIEVPSWLTLTVIAAVLTASVLASVLFPSTTSRSEDLPST